MRLYRSFARLSYELVYYDFVAVFLLFSETFDIVLNKAFRLGYLHECRYFFDDIYPGSERFDTESHIGKLFHPFILKFSRRRIHIDRHRRQERLRRFAVA